MPAAMPSKRDSAHELYEAYFLMNFVQLPPEKQLEHFYLRRIVPVPPEAHYQAVTLDTYYNHLIINPIYQLFVCIGLYSFELFPLLANLYGIGGERYERCDRWQPRLFSERFQAAFLGNLYANTSREGFCHGADWQSLRRRCRILLKAADLLENPWQLSFPKPLKLSGFLYPDDFDCYEAVPYWSHYGETMARAEWNEMKVMYDELYLNSAGVSTLPTLSTSFHGETESQ